MTSAENKKNAGRDKGKKMIYKKLNFEKKLILNLCKHKTLIVI